MKISVVSNVRPNYGKPGSEHPPTTLKQGRSVWDIPQRKLKLSLQLHSSHRGMSDGEKTTVAQKLCTSRGATPGVRGGIKMSPELS